MMKDQPLLMNHDHFWLQYQYALALDNYGQSCFVRSDFLKMKCVCKTQMILPPDHQNPVDMHTSIMCINILQNIKAVAPIRFRATALIFCRMFIHIMEVYMSTGF
jgi:hypothetical protein